MKENSLTKDALVGLISGSVAGIAMGLIGESNTELASLTLESLVPASAVAAYYAVEPISNKRKPSLTKTAVGSGATMVGYVVTRILYS